MLQVNMEEYIKYENIVKQGADIGHDVETAFRNAAKFSYQVLKDRGYTSITHSQVDKLLTKIILQVHSYMRGILLVNAQKDDLEDLKTDHYIYYA